MSYSLPSVPTLRCCGRVDDAGVVELPVGVAEHLGSRPVMIEAVLEGFPIRVQVRPLPGGGMGFALSENQLAAAGARCGHEVSVEVARVGDSPEVRVPEDFAEALRDAPGAGGLWEQITPMARREWVRWIASAKQEETRQRRIRVGLEKLHEGMRRPCCFPGLNWVVKGKVPPEETWVALPGTSKAVR